MYKLILTIMLLASSAFGQVVNSGGLRTDEDLFDIGGGTKVSTFISNSPNIWDNDTST